MRDVQRLEGCAKLFAGCVRFYAWGRYGTKCRDVQRLGLKAAQKGCEKSCALEVSRKKAECRDVQRLAKLARGVH